MLLRLSNKLPIRRLPVLVSSPAGRSPYVQFDFRIVVNNARPVATGSPCLFLMPLYVAVDLVYNEPPVHSVSLDMANQVHPTGSFDSFFQPQPPPPPRNSPPVTINRPCAARNKSRWAFPKSCFGYKHRGPVFLGDLHSEKNLGADRKQMETPRRCRRLLFLSNLCDCRINKIPWDYSIRPEAATFR